MSSLNKLIHGKEDDHVGLSMQDSILRERGIRERYTLQLNLFAVTEFLPNRPILGVVS